MDDNKMYYNIGKRDCLAEVFMLIKKNDGDFNKTFKFLINEYEKSDKENPHCQWLKEKLLIL